MFNQLKQASKDIWWTVVLSGIAAIIFGLIAIIWPGITLAVLVLVFSICIVFVGIIGLVRALSSIKTDKLWWMTLLFAVVCIGLGIYLFLNPPATIALFVILLAIFIFAQAIFDLIVASYSKDSGKWLWVVIGALGLIFGFIILFHPAAASLAFVWVLGVYALIHGVISLVYAFRARLKVKKVLK